MNKVQICYSPALYPHYHADEQIVVVVDILRATSAMTTAIAHGAEHIVPVAKLFDADDFRSRGYLVAAERDGKIVEGYELGNSPYSFMGDAVKGKKIVLSTTNGTQAIEAAREAHELLIGAFINITAIAGYLKSKNKDVLILCAGWKNRFNLEDTLFAGALSELLLANDAYSSDDDAVRAAIILHSHAAGNYYDFLENSSHRKRLGKLDLKRDIDYCLSRDLVNTVPILKEDRIVDAKTLFQPA
jgi:2-phosphosulfolactate phosphatase